METPSGPDSAPNPAQMPTATTRRRRLVSIVVPFYNESAAVEKFHAAVRSVFDLAPDVDFEVVCVDDGSRDDTLQKLVAIAKRDPRFWVIMLSRNFGKEAALTAGIDGARGDAVIPLDADLQDPPELIPTLIQKWQQGAEIVLARRTDRSADTFFKRKMAELFYNFHNQLSDVQIPRNVGDFRLMDRRAVNALKKLPERQRFMKGLFAWIGFETVVVDYKRNPRSAGDTKYSGWKLWNFALEGLTSFSTAPLKMWTYVGAVSALITFGYATFIVFRTLIYGIDVPGYASLLVAILFFGSLQLITAGMLGEYLGRIYMETKQRPTYLVRDSYRADEDRAPEQ